MTIDLLFAKKNCEDLNDLESDTNTTEIRYKHTFFVHSQKLLKIRESYFERFEFFT